MKVSGFVICGSFFVLILFSLWLLCISSVINGKLLFLIVLISRVLIVFLIGRLNCLISFVMVFVFGVLISVIFWVVVVCGFFGVIVFVSLMFVV